MWPAEELSRGWSPAWSAAPTLCLDPPPPGRSLVERFAALPTPAQVLIALAPYSLLLGVLFALYRAADDHRFVPSALAAPPPPIEALPEGDPPLEELPALVAPAPLVPDEAPVVEVEIPAPERRALVAKKKTRLYVRPDRRARTAAWVDRRARLVVIERFETRRGWHLVETERGTIGFARAKDLR